jgi:uncharacterized membrane protein YfcA
MDIVVIVLASFVTAILTLFSGFGFGTISMPVFAFFFPIDMAIALTGVVIACLVDFTRLSVYASRFKSAYLH